MSSFSVCMIFKTPPCGLLSLKLILIWSEVELESHNISLQREREKGVKMRERGLEGGAAVKRRITGGKWKNEKDVDEVTAAGEEELKPGQEVTVTHTHTFSTCSQMLTDVTCVFRCVCVSFSSLCLFLSRLFLYFYCHQLFCHSLSRMSNLCLSVFLAVCLSQS